MEVFQGTITQISSKLGSLISVTSCRLLLFCCTAFTLAISFCIKLITWSSLCNRCSIFLLSTIWWGDCSRSSTMGGYIRMGASFPICSKMSFLPITRSCQRPHRSKLSMWMEIISGTQGILSHGCSFTSASVGQSFSWSGVWVLQSWKRNKCGIRR